TLYRLYRLVYFLLSYPAPTEISTLSLHDALPIYSSVRLGPVDLLADGHIKHPAEQQRRVVTPRAPFRGPHSRDVLHVFDAFAVPLIVEGREAVCRAGPLRINVNVTALAGVGLHEILRGNLAAVCGLRRAGKEKSLRAIAFAVHGGRWHLRILDAVRAWPTHFAEPPGRARHDRKRSKQCGIAQPPSTAARAKPSSHASPLSDEQDNARKAEADVGVQPRTQRPRRAGENQRQAHDRPGSEQNPS